MRWWILDKHYNDLDKVMSMFMVLKERSDNIQFSAFWMEAVLLSWNRFKAINHNWHQLWIVCNLKLVLQSLMGIAQYLSDVSWIFYNLHVSFDQVNTWKMTIERQVVFCANDTHDLYILLIPFFISILSHLV